MLTLPVHRPVRAARQQLGLPQVSRRRIAAVAVAPSVGAAPRPSALTAVAVVPAWALPQRQRQREALAKPASVREQRLRARSSTMLQEDVAMKNATKLRLTGKSVALSALLALAALALPQACAQADGQKTFSSSKEAVNGFIQAVRDGNNSTLLAILGPGTEAIISTSDAVADKTARDHFLADYDVKHSLTGSAPNQLSLNVGKDGWPFPIPLVH